MSERAVWVLIEVCLGTAVVLSGWSAWQIILGRRADRAADQAAAGEALCTRHANEETKRRLVDSLDDDDLAAFNEGRTSLILPALPLVEEVHFQFWERELQDADGPAA
ncbi:hypothetical protein [Nocardioides bruguierae]|uniref:Uncharacterized protein n=1 Tax=Nocardioides bruguierae TaxID=2945102 RepID=A0A9X2D5Q7_9ACTN|nr:hypothetical protein [Nocardioides bruguierae]MCM0619813.1 hypothetical protein [Nocardioides bruguierae]